MSISRYATFSNTGLFSASNTINNKNHGVVVLPFQQTRPPNSPFLAELKQKLLLPQNEAAGIRYNVPLLNSLVLHVGMQASTYFYKLVLTL